MMWLVYSVISVHQGTPAFMSSIILYFLFLYYTVLLSSIVVDSFNRIQ